MMETVDKYKAAAEFDRAFETRKWIKKIPYIKFPADWEVQIIPPFSGAIARFRVNNKVSIYLDVYDLLGCYGEPYWEVYPHKDDVYRCKMAETDILIRAISESIEQQKQQEE